MTIREKLESMRQSSIALNIAGDEEYKTAGTRFGGSPDVPQDFVWPRFAGQGLDGRQRELPLAFVAQINCEDIAPFDTEHKLPDHGLLSFFYEMESEPWGYSPSDKGSARVYWFEDTAGLAEAVFPADLDEEFRLPMMKITAGAESSLPCWDDFLKKYPEETDDEAFDAAVEEMAGEERDDASRLLGWPEVIQHSMYEECDLVTKGYYLGNPEGYARVPAKDRAEAESAIDRWQLLFQLDVVESDDFCLMFGDCGLLYIFITKEDLAARNFSNVWAVIQCC